MSIDLLPGVPMDNALKGLRVAHSWLGSIPSGGASDRYDSHIQWAEPFPIVSGDYPPRRGGVRGRTR